MTSFDVLAAELVESLGLARFLFNKLCRKPISKTRSKDKRLDHTFLGLSPNPIPPLWKGELVAACSRCFADHDAALDAIIERSERIDPRNGVLVSGWEFYIAWLLRILMIEDIKYYHWL